MSWKRVAARSRYRADGRPRAHVPADGEPDERQRAGRRQVRAAATLHGSFGDGTTGAKASAKLRK
jgi:hypothetical protein